MDGFRLYKTSDIVNLINYRAGETKVGQCVELVSSLEEIESSPAKFVILGIPEDIGILANKGIPGASTAWEPTLKAILNMQSNEYLSGKELLVLGHFDFHEATNASNEELQRRVSEIDDLVSPIISRIAGAGKVPIIIGGGHNNAYPIIKGIALARNEAINVVNIDAHADLRPTDGRHSGNGFSYALRDLYLANYGVFGLHQSYNNQQILNKMKDATNIYPIFFEDLLYSGQPLFKTWSDLLANLDNPGLEIDLDAIENALSSAATPSGFQVNQLRELIMKTEKKFAYLHICEGVVKRGDGESSSLTSKLIAYLVTDFIKKQKTV